MSSKSKQQNISVVWQTAYELSDVSVLQYCTIIITDIFYSQFVG